MPEAGGANIEIAKHLSEHGESSEHVILEIFEALVLAIVAISTAWSGYQAALWTGHQSELYGQASKLRVQAEGAATYANQERLYNASTVVEWLKAEAHGDKKLIDLFERRFLPEFRPAFEAWKKTDPLNNPSAPAGPPVVTEPPWVGPHWWCGPRAHELDVSPASAAIPGNCGSWPNTSSSHAVAGSAPSTPR